MITHQILGDDMQAVVDTGRLVAFDEASSTTSNRSAASRRACSAVKDCSSRR
jgi:hypothetical protein